MAGIGDAGRDGATVSICETIKFGEAAFRHIASTATSAENSGGQAKRLRHRGSSGPPPIHAPRFQVQNIRLLQETH
jgi:hypothetical protein